MTAKQQYKYQREACKEIRMELNKGFAGFILSLPIGINYGAWVKLHKIKGDYE